MTMTQLRPRDTTTSEARTAPVVDLRPPGRRVRTPEIVVGVLVTTVFALGAVLWHLGTVEKVPALVVAANVQRGDVVEPGDVGVSYVSSDSPLARLDRADMSKVVGRVALVDLAKGTVITPSMVADAAAVAEGDGVVGLSLDPGAYPALGLAPGDRVNVVRTADAAALDAEPVVVARDAVVYAVEELASDRLLVSVHTSEPQADAVAANAGAGGLRLVLVAP